MIVGNTIPTDIMIHSTEEASATRWVPRACHVCVGVLHTPSV
jgi:hypothetical protein